MRPDDKRDTIQTLRDQYRISGERMITSAGRSAAKDFQTVRAWLLDSYGPVDALNRLERLFTSGGNSPLQCGLHKRCEHGRTFYAHCKECQLKGFCDCPKCRAETLATGE